LWGVVVVTKLFHEFGHAISCRRLGASCHEIGVLLFMFGPTLYCDTTDGWMLASRWRRIAIGAAGMYVEAFLGTAALVAWTLTPDGIGRSLLLNLSLVTAVSTVLFNLNPLMRLDGYYILSDLLGVPNLKQRSDRVVGRVLGHLCLGIRPETVDPEEDGATWWLLLYASAAFVYRTVFLCTILLLVRDWMNPRSLEDVGNFIAFVVVATAVWSVGSTLRKKWKERGAKPMRAKHLIATGGLSAALIAGGLFVPVPWLTTSDVVVEPFDPVAVFTTVPGRLEEITRRPGDRVLAGDVVAKLANDELEEQRLDLTLRRSAAAVQRRVAVANADSTSVRLADEQISGLDAALAEVDRRIARLTVVAPSDGLLVAASERPDTSDGDRLETWSGRPTDPQNAGAFFEPGTLLGTIATGDDYQVRLYVPQHVRDDLEVGQPVSIRIESVPDRLFEGTIEEFAPEGQEFAEEAVSVKYGGGFATETDRSGRERFLTPSYVARVRVGDPDGLIVPGTRGVARFSRKSRPALSWLWRSAQQLIALR
ncbi:MAG: HlyD family efflux transporter periplasmic adaptor subunit, partial [Planctomycetota bacterium]